jgi:uncharacterized membrane protein
MDPKTPDIAATLATPPGRLPRVDQARGLAILAMILYHFVWDLSFLGLIDPATRDSAGWTGFARVIASSFLILSGIGLVLAHGGGSGSPGFDRRKFLRRLALVGGAAGLVSLATYLAFPDNFIFFGILHAIALGSVLALPFLRAPLWLVVIGMVTAWTLPFLIQSAALAHPALIWLGLGNRMPNSSDFVPVFPWFGFVLLGLAGARLAGRDGFAGPGLAGRAGAWLGQAGRWSLPIYLIHQPILYGSLALVASLVVTQPDPEARPFLSACRQQCEANGGDAPTCTRLCTCAMESAKADGLWASMLRDQLNDEQRRRVEAIGKRCSELSTLR